MDRILDFWHVSLGIASHLLHTCPHFHLHSLFPPSITSHSGLTLSRSPLALKVRSRSRTFVLCTCAEVRKVRAHREVCKNAVCYSGTCNVPKNLINCCLQCLCHLFASQKTMKRKGWSVRNGSMQLGTQLELLFLACAFVFVIQVGRVLHTWLIVSPAFNLLISANERIITSPRCFHVASPAIVVTHPAEHS